MGYVLNKGKASATQGGLAERTRRVFAASQLFVFTAGSEIRGSQLCHQKSHHATESTVALGNVGVPPAFTLASEFSIILTPARPILEA